MLPQAHGAAAHSTRLTPRHAVHTDWAAYAASQPLGTLFAGLRGNRVEWGPVTVVSAERRRDNLYILVRGDPSLVGTVAGQWHAPIHDKLIAAFANRGQLGELSDAASSTNEAGVRAPHFDMLLRVPKAIGAETWARATELWPGQRVVANGILIAGPWPVLLEVQQLASSRMALRHAQLMRPAMKRLEQERTERQLEAQLVRICTRLYATLFCYACCSGM